jgi:hypothetical protein
MKRLLRSIRLTLREKWAFPPIWIVWVDNRVALNLTYPICGRPIFALYERAMCTKAPQLFKRLNGFEYGGGKGEFGRNNGYTPLRYRKLGLWIIKPILCGWQPELRFVK